MCHERLGKHDQAVESFHEAVQWMQTNDPDNAELIAFRNEAAQLLGIDELRNNSMFESPAGQ